MLAMIQDGRHLPVKMKQYQNPAAAEAIVGIVILIMAIVDAAAMNNEKKLKGNQYGIIW
jgi:hypothetical protein